MGKCQKNGMIVKVIPVDKGKLDKTVPAHHRAVALMCNVIKLKETLFIDKLDEKLKSIGFWHQSQFGFTKGVGCEENLLKNIMWLQHSLDNIVGKRLND